MTFLALLGGSMIFALLAIASTGDGNRYNKTAVLLSASQLAAAFFVLTTRSVTQSPKPAIPTYDVNTCNQLVFIDNRWVCVPADEAIWGLMR